MNISMRFALNQKGSALGDFDAPRFAFDHGTRFAGFRIYSIDTRRRGQSESLQAAMDATLAVLATMPRYANPLTNS
jgi:hypothetical protein